MKLTDLVLTEEVSEKEVYDAIQTVLSDRAKYPTQLNYAVGYARAALENRMKGHELAVQCLYLLNNLSTWRHAEAKNVREVLKKFAKEDERKHKEENR